jgi:hypothetical protein
MEGLGSLFRRLRAGMRRWRSRTVSQGIPSWPAALAIRSTQAITSDSTWCSQILTTFQSARSSLRKFRASLARVSAILSRQNCPNLCAHLAQCVRTEVTSAGQ